MRIDSWFNSPIALFKNEKFDLTDHCLNMKDKYPITGQHEKQNWIHGPYNSLLILENETAYNSLNDPKFFELTRWVQKCVDEFSMKDLQSDDRYTESYVRSKEIHKNFIVTGHIICRVYIMQMLKKMILE